MRFSVKAIACLTAFVAAHLGMLLCASRSAQLWATLIPTSMYVGLTVWFVYQMNESNKQP
jgi:hypothetical protein